MQAQKTGEYMKIDRDLVKFNGNYPEINYDLTADLDVKKILTFDLRKKKAKRLKNIENTPHLISLMSLKVQIFCSYFHVLYYWSFFFQLRRKRIVT